MLQCPEEIWILLKVVGLLLILMFSLLLESYKVCIWPFGFAKHVCAIPKVIVL